jgi:hypothetical protein
MWFQGIRNLFGNFKNFLAAAVDSVLLKWSNLESYNMGQAMDYFEIGLCDECYNRLKIVLSLWPKNNYARYMMGLLCIFDENYEKARKYLEQVDGPRKDNAQKLLAILRSGKSGSIVSSYREYHDLASVEDEIRSIAL